MRLISLDTETYYDKTCSVKPLGPHKYTLHPDFDCYMLSVCDGAETWVGHPKDFNWASLEGAHLVSHNAAFDRRIVATMVEQGKAPAFECESWNCSANMAAYLSGRRSLGHAVEFFYGQQISKDMRSWMEGKRWADAVAAGKDKELIEYARRDAHWCWKLYNDHHHKWPDHEKDLSDMGIRNADRGVRIDTELLRQYRQAVGDELIFLSGKLPWVKDGSPPTSPKAIAIECRRLGIPCPPVKTHDEEGFDEWERTYAPLYTWVQAVADWRSTTKVAKTLETFASRLRDDDTIESPLLYAGAHTLRWSGTGGINFQNFRKDPLHCAGVDVDIRRLIVPRPGKKFVVCDLAQIEPRVLAWLTDNQELLELMRKCSVYEAYARSAGWWNGGDMQKEAPALYALTKARVLGLGYGCGWEKFISLAAGYGVSLTEAESKEAVENFRSSNSRITALWRTLDDAFKRSVGDKLFEMELPSGRSMTYRNVRRSSRLRTQEDGTTVREGCVSAEVAKSGKVLQLPLYGGLLTENVTQAIARDVFAEHLLAMDKAGIFVPFSVHDEAVTEVDESLDPREIEAYMSVTPEWLPGCPVAAKAHNATYYKK